MSRLVYLYAILPAEAEAVGWLERAVLPGIDEGPAGALVEGSLAAAVGAVPGEDFEEEVLNSRLGDLDWLAPRATAHQRVNAELMEHTPALVPLAFGAIYRDEQGVRAMLRARRDELLDRLEAVKDRGEWVVTLERDEPLALAELEATDAELRAARAEIAATGPGRAYLLTRQLDELRRRRLAELEAAATTALDEALAGVVELAHAEPLETRLAGAPLARLSLLVRRTAEARLEKALNELGRVWAPRGYTPRATGPWPPYRFGGMPAESIHGRV